MSTTYPLESVAFAEHLLEIADQQGTDAALVTLGENWTRLDSTGPVLPLLNHWAKGYGVASLRGLLMSDTDRRAESLLRFRRGVLPVYRAGYSADTAQSGLVWHRHKRHAVAYARLIGAEFVAVGTMLSGAYIALKYIDRGCSVFFIPTDAAPAVSRVEVIGGRRNG